MLWLCLGLVASCTAFCSINLFLFLSALIFLCLSTHPFDTVWYIRGDDSFRHISLYILSCVRGGGHDIQKMDTSKLKGNVECLCLVYLEERVDNYIALGQIVFGCDLLINISPLLIWSFLLADMLCYSKENLN